MLVAALDAVVVVAVIAGPLVTRRQRVPESTKAGHPGRWLAALAALIFANQVLFTVYVIRVHHGDVSFIAQYLPTGWFDTAVDNWFINRISVAFPHPQLLGATVLRVQAFLELPFVLLAYLTVAGWAGVDLVRPAALWAASGAYTIVFCAIEISLANPYTNSDLIVRIASGLLTPIALARLGRIPQERSSMLLFVISTGALGVLVLVVYDTALLYNLGRVGRDAPFAVAGLTVLAGARFLATKVRSDPGRAGRSLADAMRTWLAWFFVPALAIRYALSFGTRWVALAAGATLTIGAAVAALWRSPGKVPLGAAAGIGAVAAGAVAAIGQPYPEARLLAAAATFIVVVTGCAAWLDRHAETVARPETTEPG